MPGGRHSTNCTSGRERNRGQFRLAYKKTLKMASCVNVAILRGISKFKVAVQAMAMCFEVWESPIGWLSVAADANAVRAVAFEANWPRIRASLGEMQAGGNALTRQAIAQLQAYFAGERQTFDLPLHLAGTPFQQRTWQALQDIPYGTTRSYAQQAAAIGQPQAVRAVGHTNGLNPLSILVPCHRVIASSGKLAGYAGGLAAKTRLLQLESGIPSLL